jgi:methyl-accepting chemotaxis protein
MSTNAEPIYRLSNRVEKIQLVIKVMDEIAQKTDLLSLNASIEATRAGELGKGFALVANEIRSMAENSKRSSQEIEDIIEAVLQDNKAVIGSLSKSESGIKKGREIIDGIVETFGQTVSGVKGIFHEIQEMEEVIVKQLDQMKSFMDYFKDLSRLAQDNYLSTQKTSQATKSQKEDIMEMARSIKSLNLLSEKMMKTQQKFTLREG